MSMAGDKFNRENRDDVIAERYIAVSDQLYEAREEIKRLQRQIDRLGKDKSRLQSQLAEAKLLRNCTSFDSFNELRHSEKDRY